LPPGSGFVDGVAPGVGFESRPDTFDAFIDTNVIEAKAYKVADTTSGLRCLKFEISGLKFIWKLERGYCRQPESSFSV